jgi:hypothetical protein
MIILRQKEYSRFGHALKHIGKGVIVGAGIGGVIGGNRSGKFGKEMYKPTLIGAGIGAIIGGTLGALIHKADWTFNHDAEEYERTHKDEVKDALKEAKLPEDIVNRLSKYNNTETNKKLNSTTFLQFELEGRGYGDYVEEFSDILYALRGGYPNVMVTNSKEIKNLVSISLKKKKTYLQLLSCAFEENEGVLQGCNTLVYDWSKKKFGVIDENWKLIGSLGSFNQAKNNCIKYLQSSKTTPKDVIDKDMYDELIESMDGMYFHDLENEFPSYEEVCKIMSGIINKVIDEYIKLVKVI